MNPEEIAQTYRDAGRQNTEANGRYKHLMYCPFTGLGLYNGFRGNRWLKNRIKIFKQFVVPSLQSQTTKDFTLWISWRHEERYNKQVKELSEYLKGTGLDFIFTYSGVCFYDDKYPPEVARDRLLSAIHGSMAELVDVTEGEKGYQWVLMTIQPSDDCYASNAIAGIQAVFKKMPELQALGFSKGYLMNYQTKEVAEWNPETNPPFYTIKFSRPAFIAPLEHVQYTALKADKEPYLKGTPLPSHEYVQYCLAYGVTDDRGFLVGTHGENISTVFDHPYRGEIADKEVLRNFGLQDVRPLKLTLSIGRIFFDRLPYKFKRKLRYLAGEKRWILRPVFSIIYNILRS